MGRRAVNERTQSAAYLYIAPAFLVVIVFTLASMGLSFYVSLHNWDPISGEGQFVGTGNYVRALTDENSVFWLALRNTAMYVVMSVVGVLITSLPLAMLCRKARYGQSLFRTLYFLPSITPMVVLSLVWIWIFQAWGEPLSSRRTALLAIAMLGVWQAAGYNMLLFLAGLSEIPGEFYDAARVDGANRWQEFRHITIPLLRNTLIFVTVMVIIGAFQVFKNAFSYAGQMGYASAMAWLLFVVLFVVIMIQMRAFRSRRTYDQ